ncbi:hypothetical protein [Peribacillus asahii]|uniref:hypothetical protein n=1 Tax=Peribacillus asahii TaxID=228899 RepID=UPI0037F22B71
MTNADKMYHKFLEACNKKNLVLDGAVGDSDSWSVAVTDTKENINTKYVIVDYTEEAVKYDEPPFQLSWYDFRDKENPCEGVEIGDYKTVAGTVKKIMKELA